MIKGATLNKGGGRLPLILGLILGLVAAALVVVYLSSAKDEGGSTQSGGAGGGLDTVVAAQNIAQGTVVTESMLKTTKVPEADRIAGAFATNEGLAGKVSRVAIAANEQISDSKVIGSDVVGAFGSNPPLSLLIEPGTRGVSAEVSALIGAGGNVRPGDFVDVILIVPVSIQGPNGEHFNDYVSGTILQDVKVVAIDQERTNPDPGAATDPDEAKQENEAATTVTLALTPTQAEVISVADECGKDHDGRLALALRGPGDTAKLSNRTEWPADGGIPSCVALLGVATLGD